MTSKVIYLGNLRTEATHLNSGDKIVTDAPLDNNGKGEAFSPTDMAATSLASCMLTIMGIKANNVNIALGKIEVDVEKIMESNPRRIAEIRLTLHISGVYSDSEKRQLKAAGLNCPVAKSLHPDLIQTIKFVWLG